MNSIEKRRLGKVVQDVVTTMASDLDPHLERWPSNRSLEPLKDELYQILDGAINDWLIEKKGQVKS